MVKVSMLVYSSTYAPELVRFDTLLHYISIKTSVNYFFHAIDETVCALWEIHNRFLIAYPLHS
jgi:hypothetical protein